jgi:hypothetical protein
VPISGWRKGRAKLGLLWNMFWVKLVLFVKDRVFSFIRWISRAIPLGAVPSVIRVRAYTTFGLVHIVHLLVPVPVTVVV